MYKLVAPSKVMSETYNHFPIKIWYESSKAPHLLPQNHEMFCVHVIMTIMCKTAKFETSSLHTYFRQ